MKKIIKFSHSFDVPLQSCYIIFYCYIVVVDSCRCCITLSVVKIEISATTWYSETDMRWHSPVLKYLTLSNIKDASDFLCHSGLTDPQEDVLVSRHFVLHLELHKGPTDLKLRGLLPERVEARQPGDLLDIYCCRFWNI